MNWSNSNNETVVSESSDRSPGEHNHSFGEDLWYDKNSKVTSSNLHASKRVGVWLLASAFPYITSFSSTIACLSRNCTRTLKYFNPKPFASLTISTVLRCRDKHPNALFCDFQYCSWSKSLSMVKSRGNSSYRWTLSEGIHIWICNVISFVKDKRVYLKLKASANKAWEEKKKSFPFDIGYFRGEIDQIEVERYWS